MSRKPLVEPPQDENKDELDEKSVVKNQTFLWHYKLGHMNFEEMQDLIRHGLLDLFEIQAYPFYMPFLDSLGAKM